MVSTMNQKYPEIHAVRELKELAGASNPLEDSGRCDVFEQRVMQTLKRESFRWRRKKRGDFFSEAVWRFVPLTSLAGLFLFVLLFFLYFKCDAPLMCGAISPPVLATTLDPFLF